MKKILEEKLDKVVEEKEFLFEFEIEKEGIYAIEITASAKSWFQNLIKLRSFLKDDDLTLKIDGIEFPKQSVKQKRLFDGEVAWNGNNLKGKKKTDLFLIKLKEGKHTLCFLSEQNPKIYSIRINQLEEDEKEINYFPKDNYPIEDGERRQWLTIILVNLVLKFLKIKAACKEGKKFLFFKRDDSDLKLVINGEIQKSDSKFHQNWYWCGWRDKGKEKTFEKELNFSPNLHYFEFLADRSPEVKEIKIGIEKEKRIPSMEDPKGTGNFYDDPKEIILARLIFGESRGVSREAKIAVGWVVRNRVEDPRWPNTYHEVILQKGQFVSFEEGDPNFEYVKNPLLDLSQRKAWQECYEITKGIINNEIGDPTGGANHFYSTDIPKPYWADDNKFVVQIDNLRFYKL